MSILTALAIGVFEILFNRFKFPIIIPAWGPPNNLSAENKTNEAPFFMLSSGVGSCTNPNGSVSIKQPLPIS